MSDWEEEYDEGGVAIQKPATKSAPTEWKPPSYDSRRENVCFGVRGGGRSGAPREWRADRGGGGEGSEYTSRANGGEGRPGRRTFGDERPVTFTVESASVGRVIGKVREQ